MYSVFIIDYNYSSADKQFFMTGKTVVFNGAGLQLANNSFLLQSKSFADYLSVKTGLYQIEIVLFSDVENKRLKSILLTGY